jgi:hypothetical protein
VALKKPSLQHIFIDYGKKNGIEDFYIQKKYIIQLIEEGILSVNVVPVVKSTSTLGSTDATQAKVPAAVTKSGDSIQKGVSFDSDNDEDFVVKLFKKIFLSYEKEEHIHHFTYSDLLFFEYVIDHCAFRQIVLNKGYPQELRSAIQQDLLKFKEFLSKGKVIGHKELND